MNDLPEPLVPPECSMAGNDWFPFHFDRLRKSKWWRRASDTARARNVMMWGEAYKAVPAGSLPDDDDELAEAAGYGMDVESFIAVKAEIMAPWVLCSDGRWYHPTVCEMVLDVWERTGSKRKAESTRKADYRQRVREGRVVPRKKDDVPRDTPPDVPPVDPMSRGTPHVVPVGLGLQTQQTQQDIENAKAFLSLSSDETPKKVSDVQAAFDAWNVMAGRVNLPKAKTLDDGRRRAIAKRLEDGGLDGWNEALAAVARSRHCRGENEREWKADIDFVCQPKSWRRLREGFYGGGAQEPASPVDLPPWSGPREVWDKIAREMSPEWAASYLGQCTWRDVPRRALVCGKRFVVETIQREVGLVLASLDVSIIEEKAA